MLTLLPPFAVTSAMILTTLVLLWLISLARRDASIVDIFWGPGFVLAAWLYRALGPEANLRHLVPLALVTLWGIRLAIHIGWRNHGKGEDYRYQAMREEHGDRFGWISLWTVFILQGVLILVISTPHLVLQSAVLEPTWHPTLIVGSLVFALGFFFEVVGDYQLARFKADPSQRGKVLRHGLWALSRHPNYFGDATVWWSFYIFALGAPGGVWTFPAPLLMTLFLLKVSGVALLEKTISERRPEYRDYIESTSAFIPWFPKKRRGDGR
jgi:steroid 5-alpha reductase family enzyme